MNEDNLAVTSSSALLDPAKLCDMGHSEYDAAWIARVPVPGSRVPAFPEVLDVVRSTQAEDGGWAPAVDYPSARILATLASILAVTEHDRDTESLAMAAAGAKLVQQLWPRIDASHEVTIGFELLAPTLLSEACQRGLPLHALLPKAEALAEKKRRLLPEDRMYDPHLSASFSLEILGDRLDPERASRLRLQGGSIGASVAATAYYAARTGDPAALSYLAEVIAEHGPGNIPYGSPVTLWPTIWVLHHLDMVGIPVDPEVRSRAISFITGSFHRHGMTWTSVVEYADSDVTSLALATSQRAGISADFSLLDKFESDQGFLCYLSERGPSTSANAHVLHALLSGQHPESARLAKKAARFLVEARRPDGRWVDKWHASPYYPTSRAIQSLLAFGETGAVREAIDWLLATQRPDGSWGHYTRGTAEETAYSVHALAAYLDGGHAEVREAISRGAAFLGAFDGSEPAAAHPPLWISKVLYRPLAVIRSAVLAARAMGARAAAHGSSSS